MKACPACGGTLEVFLLRPDVPVHQNLLYGSEAEARAAPRGTLALAHCAGCDLVSNTAFDPARLQYEQSYDSDQSHSAVFMQHVDGLVERLSGAGLRAERVIEVGCGSGYFLRRLCQRAGSRGLGYDPGYRGPERDAASCTRFVRGLFSPAEAPDTRYLLCRHVIEHVQRPVEFMGALTAGLNLRSAWFETPSLEWIVEQSAVWDLFYEHCNYFSAAALGHVVRAAGLKLRALERVFDGQYFWLETTTLDVPPLAPPALGRAAVQAFGRRCQERQMRLAAVLEALAGSGPVAVWGAAAKGATYVNLLDPDGTRVRCLADINPERQGRFVPGSGHAIVAPERLSELGVREVLVMNPNYLGEVAAWLAERGSPARVHPVNE